MPRNRYYHVIKDLEIHENFGLLLMIKEYHHQAQSFELARRDPAGLVNMILLRIKYRIASTDTPNLWFFSWQYNLVYVAR